MIFNSNKKLKKGNDCVIQQQHTSDLVAAEVEALNNESSVYLRSLSNISDKKKNKKFDNSQSFITTKLIPLFSPPSHNSKEEFTRKEKYLIFAIAAISQIINQATTQGLLPALPIIQIELNTSETITNITVAVHALMVGLLSSVWATYADSYGRRTVFIISNIFSVLGNVGSALSINAEMLIGFRVTSSVGAAASNALGAGMINDVFEDHEKGKALSWYSTISLYSISSSPFLGGILTQYFGWRSILWSFVIAYGLLWVIAIPLLPETNVQRVQWRKQQRNDSISISSTKEKSINENKTISLWIKKANEMNPFASLRLLKFPNMLLCCLYLGCTGFANSALGVSFAWAYDSQYHFSSTFTGLWYLTGLIGSTAGTLIGGTMSDRVYIRRTEKAKLNADSIFPEMRLSQQWIIFAALSMALSFIGYGWSLEKNGHFSIGVVCLIFAQFGLTITNCFINVYAVQSFPKHGSSAQGCIQTIKCILMSLGSLSIVDLEKLLGYGPIHTIIGGLLLITTPFVIYIQKNQTKWQRAREKLMNT